MPTRKNSKKRQVILEALAATTAHPTAQELYQQLMSMSRKLQYQQLVEAGALGRLPLSASTIWIRRMPGSCFRERKGRTARRRCISSSGKM